MIVKLEPAREKDAAGIAALRVGVARQLTERYGRGTWSYVAESEWGVRADIMTSNVYVVRQGGTVVATLRLSTKVPWVGDTTFFTIERTVLYLTSMAVAPKLQRTGIGRACLEEVKRVATEWPANVVRLDAYDAPAGAGEFYRKAGWTEVHRAPYNGTPLIYFEWRVGSEKAEGLKD